MTRPATIAALRALAADLMQDAQHWEDKAIVYAEKQKPSNERHALLKMRRAKIHLSTVESAIEHLQAIDTKGECT